LLFLKEKIKRKFEKKVQGKGFEPLFTGTTRIDSQLFFELAKRTFSL